MQRNLAFIFILLTGKVGFGATDPATGNLYGTVYPKNGSQVLA